MGRIICHALEIIKEAVIEHVTAIFAVRNGLEAEIALDLDNPEDLFVLNFLELFFGEFARFHIFACLDDDGGTFKGANMLASERWRDRSGVSSAIIGRKYGDMIAVKIVCFVD
jgi:hypothetical protein